MSRSRTFPVVLTRSAMACRGPQTHPLLSTASFEDQESSVLPLPSAGQCHGLGRPVGTCEHMQHTAGSSDRDGAAPKLELWLLCEFRSASHSDRQRSYLLPHILSFSSHQADNLEAQDTMGAGPSRAGTTAVRPFPLSSMTSLIALLNRIVPRVPTYLDALHLAMIVLCACGLSVPRIAANARNRPAKVSPSHRHPAPP